jgi:peptidoglycan/xylan/chitin deacetylase (PgdA/CDA1 family)
MELVNTAVRRVLAINGAVRLAKHLLPADCTTILTLHRFTDRREERPGIESTELAASLAFLRSNGFKFTTLESVISRVRNREPIENRTVCFTVDDGYADFMHIGLPAFEKFDCPVTVFLITGFTNGAIWPWWDQVDYVFRSTCRVSFAMNVDTQIVSAAWSEAATRMNVAGAFMEKLKRVSEPLKHRAIEELAEQLEVGIPAQCPDRYSALTWGDVDACSRRGVTFAPHTVTHPILSQVTDAQAEHEINGSWRQLVERNSAAVPILAYPNGDTASFGDREERLARAAGLEAAVTTEGRQVSRHGRHGLYRIPRYDYRAPADLKSVILGIEDAKRRVREVAARYTKANRLMKWHT